MTKCKVMNVCKVTWLCKNNIKMSSHVMSISTCIHKHKFIVIFHICLSAKEFIKFRFSRQYFAV